MTTDHQNESPGMMTDSSANIAKLMSAMESLGVGIQNNRAFKLTHCALMANAGAGTPAPRHCALHTVVLSLIVYVNTYM